MKHAKLALAAGALLVGGGGVANAEPVALTDSQMDGVTAGVGFSSFTTVIKLVDIQELIVQQKAAQFDVYTNVVGFSALAEAEADAEGPNADAQTFTFAEITPSLYMPPNELSGYFKANSLSLSIALVSF
jgi:hypothetical protein